MLDKQKVRLMTELAFYEQTQGKEDFKINEYYRKDYIGFHTVCSIVWVTVGYAFMVGLSVFAAFDWILDNFSKGLIIMTGLTVIVGYFAIVLIYFTISYHLFKKKYNGVVQRMKRYDGNLTKLLDMYEKENK